VKATTADGYRLFHEGSVALAQVEANGIRIDMKYLEHTYYEIGDKCNDLIKALKEDEVWKTWTRRFGSKSTLGNKQQMAAVFFDEKERGGLGYTSKGGRTKRGHKADEASFDHIDHPFVKTYNRLEKYKKAHNTYLRGMLREVQDGYLHCFFNLAGGGGGSEEEKGGAQTYRSSSSHINFQNIPTRLEMLKNIIRRCFIPRKGHQIVEFDFKGIEVGIAACYHKDPTMIKYVSDKKKDMHRDTGMDLFFLTKEQITGPIRHIAKNKFVFPQFYGDFYVSCTRNIWEEISKTKPKLSDDTLLIDHLARIGIKDVGACDTESRPIEGTLEYRVKEVEDLFWNERFPVYTQWKKDWWTQYQRTGYFDMYTGFRVGGMYRKNQVINYPVQGAAFHCLLWCLIRLQRWLIKHNMRSKIVGQIHDSLILDIHEDELDEIIAKTQQLMSKDLPAAWDWIIVPLEVEIEVAPPGKSWLDKGKWVNKEGTWQLKV
jgi:DNA polymerase-1